MKLSVELRFGVYWVRVSFFFLLVLVPWRVCVVSLLQQDPPALTRIWLTLATALPGCLPLRLLDCLVEDPLLADASDEAAELPARGGAFSFSVSVA